MISVNDARLKIFERTSCRPYGAIMVSINGASLETFKNPPRASGFNSLPSLSYRFLPKLKYVSFQGYLLAESYYHAAVVNGWLSLILGHHFFYASLDCKDVSTELHSIAGQNLSQQQLNTSLGTAFTLLVKICLAVAVSTAYIQIFWRSTRTAEPPTLVQLDLANAGLASIFSFCNPRFWWRYPSLVLLGLVFWLVLKR